MEYRYAPPPLQLKHVHASDTTASDTAASDTTHDARDTTNEVHVGDATKDQLLRIN